MKRGRSVPWVWVGLATLILLVVGGIGLTFIGVVLAGSGAGVGAQVGLVELSGPIADEGEGGALGASTRGARNVIEELEKARHDDTIKAVVLRINSPGGSAAASQEIYQAVRRLKEAKPVICSMGDVAASGGYYVAAACDEIYANGSTITGSIGVITQLVNIHELIKKYGVSAPTIASGKFKAAGSPFQPLAPAEREIFRTMVMNVYQQFVSDVATGRQGKLTRAQVLKLADGRVYTGQQAKANRLIDQLGGLHEAVQAAARRGGIKDKAPKVKRLSPRGGLFGALLGADADAAIQREIGQAGAMAGRSAGQAFTEAVTRQWKSEAVAPAGPQAR
jgi:protease IV